MALQHLLNELVQIANKAGCYKKKFGYLLTLRNRLYKGADEMYLADKSNKALRYEGIWRSGGIATPFLTSAQDEGEWSASCPSCYAPQDTDPSIRWLRSWVGSQTSLEAGPLLGIEPSHLSHPVHTIVDILTELLQAKRSQKQEILEAGLML
jgi:hypothetical protein